MLLNSLLMGLRSQAVMQAEIIALRHQLNVLQRNQPKRLVLSRGDRCLWVWFSRLWSGWRYSLIIVKPETIIGWGIVKDFDGTGLGRFATVGPDVLEFREKLGI
jgi:hypothetical protein